MKSFVNTKIAFMVLLILISKLAFAESKIEFVNKKIKILLLVTLTQFKF